LNTCRNWNRDKKSAQWEPWWEKRKKRPEKLWW